MSDFLGALLDRIDASGNGFSEAAYNALSVDLRPLINLLFVAYVAWYGLQLIMGTARVSIADIVLRIVRMFFILLIITSWGNFDQLLYGWVTSVPEAAGRSILSATGTGITEPTNGLSQIWATANEAAAKFSEQSGYFSVLPALTGFLIMIVTGFFIAVALAILILSKVMMWILLGTAPIFLSMFLFEKTANYALGWLNQVLLYALIPLFVYAVAAFLIAAINPDLAAIGSAAEDNTLKLSDLAAFILLCLAGGFVMLNIQSMSAGITGALGAAIGHAAGRFIGSSSRGAFTSSRAAASGSVSLVQSVQSRANPSSRAVEGSMQRAIQQNSTPS